jgi:hypothetical protein
MSTASYGDEQTQRHEVNLHDEREERRVEERKENV